MTPLSLLAALEQGTLPEGTAARLRDALALAARDVAVQDLVGLLDPERQRSCWWLAGEIERLLRRFESGGWPRVRAGHRLPRGPIEEALVVMLSCPSCPRTQRKLFDLI